MFLLNKVLVSSEIITVRFSCNLSECRGMCCCEGDCGAAIEYDEIGILQSSLEEILSYLKKESVSKIKREGFWKRSIWGGYEISLCDDGFCVYAVEQDGIILCGIELAWKDKKIAFRKPLSCQLYPIRIRKFGIFEGLIYEHWDICRSDNSENAPLLFEFVSDALQKKYGVDFVEKLRKISQK